MLYTWAKELRNSVKKNIHIFSNTNDYFVHTMEVRVFIYACGRWVLFLMDNVLLGKLESNEKQWYFFSLSPTTLLLVRCWCWWKPSLFQYLYENNDCLWLHCIQYVLTILVWGIHASVGKNKNEMRKYRTLIIFDKLLYVLLAYST